MQRVRTIVRCWSLEAGGMEESIVARSHWPKGRRLHIAAVVVQSLKAHKVPSGVLGAVEPMG